jgi:hypothetical protein
MLFTHRSLKLLKITKDITYVNSRNDLNNFIPLITVSDICVGDQPFYSHNRNSNINYLNMLSKSAIIDLGMTLIKNKSRYTLLLGTRSVGINIQGETIKKTEHYDKCFIKVSSCLYTKSIRGSKSWCNASLNGVRVGELKHKIMNNGYGESTSHYIFKLNDTFININDPNDDIDHLLQIYQTSLINVKNACWVRRQHRNRKYLFSLLPREIINIIVNEIYVEAWALTIKILNEISQTKCYND